MSNGVCHAYNRNQLKMIFTSFTHSGGMGGIQARSLIDGMAQSDI
jgi:hypothetical protein